LKWGIMRFVLATLVFVVFPLSAFAQQEFPEQVVPHDHPPDDCYTTLKSGSGATYTKVCISSTGNITSYESPAGVEHIRVLWVIEGYRVCHGPTDNDGDGLIEQGAPSFDSGVWEHGFVGEEEGGAARIYQPNGRNTLPLRITRYGDPRLRIVQEFFWRTWNYGPAELYISIKVYNDGRVTVPGVSIQRFFDGDIDGSWANHAYATRSSALLFNPSGNGLSLSAGILDKAHHAGVGGFTTTQGLVEEGTAPQCNAGEDADGSPHPGDKIGVVTYTVGDILPGRVKSVAFIYRRF